MTEARLDVVIGAAGAQSGGAAVLRVVEQVRANFINLAAQAFVAQQALESLWGMARRGAETAETMSRLDRQMRQFGSSADVMTRAVKDAVQGQLTLSNAAQISSRALATGLNPDQVLTFVEAAEALSDVTGGDIPQAFEELVNAAVTGRGKVLASLGVYIDLEDEMKRLAVETGRTTEQITRQERAMLMTKLITEQAKDKIKELNGELSDADKIKAIEVRWAELWDTINLKIKTATFSIIDFNSRVKDFLNSPFGALIPGAGLISKGISALTDRDPASTTKPTFGPGSGGDGGGTPGPAISLLAAGLESERTRAIARTQADFRRQVEAISSLSQLYEIDVQRGLATEEQVVTMRAENRIKEVDLRRQGLERELQLERDFHARRVKMGFESTESKIAEEERYKGAVDTIRDRLLDNARERNAAEQQNDAEKALAREQAQARLGQRLTDAGISQFQIQEEIRQRDLQSAELYYRGQIDLAQANFASDQEIAGKERLLLQEQLAFKLRLTRDEIEEILKLRRQGNLTGAGALLSRGDPLLSAGAREGILASGEAQDIRLRERQEGSFFTGWARGLQDYTHRTQGAFNLANDMARRTAQTMESSFQQFFFDPMKDGWRGVLDSMLTMTRQIVSQIAAQFVTSGLLNLLQSFAVGAGGGGSFTSFFALAGSRNVANVLPGRAAGGVDNWGTGTPVMMHGWEAAVPLPDGRSIPVSMRLPGGGSPGGPSGGLTVNVINQAGADVQARQKMNGAGMPELEILVTRAVNRSINEGRHDKALRSRFGITPGER